MISKPAVAKNGYFEMPASTAAALPKGTFGPFLTGTALDNELLFLF